MAERWSDILQLRPRGVESRWCLQGPGNALAALACDLGLHAAAGPLPPQAQRRGAAGLWLQLGPQEAWWMPGSDPPGAAAARVETALRSGSGLLRLGDPAGTDRGATDNGPVIACADLGDAFIGWDLAGPGWDEFLALGCPLDLARLGSGRCARTRLAQAPVVLAPQAQQGCTLWTERSHGAYLGRWLDLAASSTC